MAEALAPSRKPNQLTISLVYMMQRPASLSRELQSQSSVPLLLHSLRESRGSVLSLATDDKHIYAGTQRQDILVLGLLRFSVRASHFVLGMGQSRFHSSTYPPWPLGKCASVGICRG
jgi:hypothetical protein